MRKLILLALLVITFPCYAESPSQNITTIRNYIQKHYPSVSTSDSQDIAVTIVKECLIQNQDPILIASLIAHESKFNHKAKGRGGSAGLGQLMPGTYRLFKIENPLSITQNIYATVAYVAQLATYFPEKNNIQDLTIASYHRGEMFVKRHIKNLGKRTESYVQKIKKRYKKIEGKTPTTNAEPQ